MTLAPTLAACIAVVPLAAARADEPEMPVISAEILPGWQNADGTRMAALRLVLAQGWKTYWRAPGDTGIPPRFDWTGSENLANATLHWPRPDVFYQNGMRSIGYKHELVLPIELTPHSVGQPMTIKGHVELGVCEDICMPMTLDIEADLGDTASPEPIRAALAQRPMTATEAGIGDVTCTTTPIDDGLRLTASIPVPALGPKEVAVVELTDPDIWVAEAEVSRSGTRLTATADMVPASAAPFDLDKSSVRITLLSGSTAVDIQGCADR